MSDLLSRLEKDFYGSMGPVFFERFACFIMSVIRICWLRNFIGEKSSGLSICLCYLVLFHKNLPVRITISQVAGEFVAGVICGPTEMGAFLRMFSLHNLALLAEHGKNLSK